MHNDQLQPDYSNKPQQLELVTDSTPALYLPVDDADLLSSIRSKENATKQYFDSTLKLPERQKRNRDFWRGQHYDNPNSFEKWQSDFTDPVIYEDLETRITLASARMPDIIVTPPNDNNESINSAATFEKILGIKINTAFTQRLIKRGLRSHHLNFFAVAKGRWDPNLANGTGDFVFELIRPDRILFDHTATIPDNGFTADNMEYIIEYLEEPLDLMLSKFPDKRGQILAKVGAEESKGKKISKIMYKEVWFTWYGKEGEIYEGLAHIYQDIVLDKIRNPYYDWEGYQVVKPATAKDGSYKTGANLEKETRFYNYCERPRKPYIFFTYQNLDESPVDDTTPVEQAIPAQKLLNRIGRQITEISDNAVPKKVFAGKYISKEEARRVTSDPDENIWLDGADNVNDAFTTTVAQPPSPQLLALQRDARMRIDALFSTHGTTKGEISSNESGTSKQISREGDLTMSDDLVDIVVERVVYEMACWATQFMKLFYDQPHYVRQMGQDGSVLYKELSRTDIPDGLMIDVKASSIDAMTRRSDAVNLASRKAIDPLSMFEDMELPNPKERVRRLISFLNGTNDGFATYMAEIDVEFEYQKQAPAGTPGGSNANSQQAQTDLKDMIAGNKIAPPDQFDESYVTTISDFVNSGQFDQLDPEIQQTITEYIDALEQNFQNFSVSTPNAIAPPVQ